MSENEQTQNVEAIQKDALALEKSRALREQIKINTLSTSRTIRKKIIIFYGGLQDA